MAAQKRGGYRMDMVHGPLAGKVLLFALPLMASSLLQLLFNAADVVVVGRCAGEAALAAVGSTSSLINLLVNLFVGFSVGTNVVVARDMGSGREEDVSKVASARIEVDLAGASSTLRKEFSYELLDSEGNVVPSGDIRISDKQIMVTAPIYAIKELPLTVKFKSSPGSREEDIRWELTETTISVAGEPASLENITEISLGEIDLSMILSNSEQRTLEIPIPAGCENVSGYATTTIDIQFKNMETRTFSVSNISAIGLSDVQHFSKVTNSVDVTLRGPAGELDEVTEDDIRIVVDLTEFGAGTVSVPAIVLVDGHDNLVGAIGPYAVTGKITS